MKVPLCRLDAIPDGGTTVVDFFGREVLVYSVNGAPVATVNVCVHLGGPMKRKEDRLVCQWHGAEFDCATGACLQGPARPESRAMVLPTRIENGSLVYVYGEGT